MVDQSDVEAALAGLVEAAIYPGGTGASSRLGKLVRIYRGWPVAAALDRDLAAGCVNVTVFPEAQRQVNTTRWMDDTIATVRVAPSMTVMVDRDTATLDGEPRPGQLAGLLADGVAVVHRIVAGDTVAAVAAVLGAYLRTRRAVRVAGSAVQVPGVGRLSGRVVADQLAVREARRQRQVFRVTCWCPDPETRDLTGRLVDAAVSAGAFIDLPDGTQGQVRFVSSVVLDESQNVALYRRDLIYSVEYATTISELRPSMIFGNARFALGSADLVHSLLG
jgi:hypothetical protein